MKAEISPVELALAANAATRVVERVPAALKHWLGDAVSVVLVVKDAATVTLEATRADCCARAGDGNRALGILAKIADQEQVRIELALVRTQDTAKGECPAAERETLEQSAEPPLDSAALQIWYERHGYCVVGRTADGTVLLARDANPCEASPGISRGVAECLYEDLKKYVGKVEPFRHQMHSSRIVAAEYGRGDAVEWALEWYEAIVKGKLEAQAAASNAVEQRASAVARYREQFLAGKVGNERYQLFLDTVDDPAGVANNVPYMIWINLNVGLFEKVHPASGSETRAERAALFTAFLRSVRDSNLSERVRQGQNASAQSA